MLGTIVNSLSIIAGSLIGLIIKNGLKENYKDITMQAIGLAVLFIGGASTISGLMDPSSESVLFIISLVIGGLFGEWLNIEKKLDNLGNFLQSKFGKKESNIAQGFVTASLVYCVGSLAILGSLESGLTNEHSMLYAKSILDGVSAIIFASSMGFGVIFSAGAVFIYQGTITLFANSIEPFISADIIREMSIVGGILIFSIGLSVLEIKKIKTGNLLPAIFIPVVYYIAVLPLYEYIIKFI